MKIILVNKFFFRNGGSETVFFQEREFLKQQGFQVIDFSMQHPENFRSDYANYFVSNVDYNSSVNTRAKFKSAVSMIHSKEAVKKLESLIETELPDIAHLHNIYHQLTPSIIPQLKKHSVKTVLTLHDGKLCCPSYLMLNGGQICTACASKNFWRPLVENCQKSLTKELLLMFEAYYHKWKKSYENVDLFISPSRYIAGLVSQRIPESKIKVLHNGIDINAYSPTYKDKGYCLFYGRLSKEKGVKTLLRAHMKIRDKLPLKIMGTGPLGKDLREAYPDADFLGYQKGMELKKVVSQAAFIIVPSEWNENCSMVVLEAMAMGKPVIGSKVGGIPEQIEDGITGLLFEMGNVEHLSEKMRLLGENPKLRSKLGKAARKKLESEYSLSNHCEELLNIYGELLLGN